MAARLRTHHKLAAMARSNATAFAAMALAVGVPASATEPSGPPLEDGWYVDHGACPFEGCVYRDWTVRQDTVLYDAPRGSRPVGTARAGSPVEAQTGIVYTIPIPVDVAHPISLDGPDAFVSETSHLLDRLAVGDRFFLLTYEGELFNLVWIDGHLDSLDIGAMRDASRGLDVEHFRSCDPPSNQCWWRIPEERLQRQSEWWVQIRLADDTIGWTDETANFGNMRQQG